MDFRVPVAGILAGQPTLSRQLAWAPSPPSTSGSPPVHHPKRWPGRISGIPAPPLKLAGATSRSSPTDAIARLHRVANGCRAPSTTPPRRPHRRRRKQQGPSSTMPAQGKQSPSSPATAVPARQPGHRNHAAVVPGRQLAAQAEHRRAIAEFRARVPPTSRPASRPRSETIAALARMLGAQRH